MKNLLLFNSHNCKTLCSLSRIDGYLNHLNYTIPYTINEV